MTVEDAKSVGANVHIPDLISQQSLVQMNSGQEALYEELRQRADAISNSDKDENQRLSSNILTTRFSAWSTIWTR